MPFVLASIEDVKKKWEELTKEVGAMSWKVPIIAMSDESVMDWEDDEEITDPGVGPYVHAAPTTASQETPTVDVDGIKKGSTCYVCGSNRPVHFNRSSGTLLVCVPCIYDHLGWEVAGDGSVSRVPPET